MTAAHRSSMYVRLWGVTKEDILRVIQEPESKRKFVGNKGRVGGLIPFKNLMKFVNPIF